MLIKYLSCLIGELTVLQNKEKISSGSIRHLGTAVGMTAVIAQTICGISVGISWESLFLQAIQFSL